MAKQAAVAEEKPGLIQKVQTYYEEVISELKKVTWPTKADLLASTKVTMFLIVIMAVMVFVYDQVLGVAVMMLLSLGS